MGSFTPIQPPPAPLALPPPAPEPIMEPELAAPPKPPEEKPSHKVLPLLHKGRNAICIAVLEKVAAGKGGATLAELRQLPEYRDYVSPTTIYRDVMVLRQQGLIVMKTGCKFARYWPTPQLEQ